MNLRNKFTLCELDDVWFSIDNAQAAAGQQLTNVTRAIVSVRSERIARALVVLGKKFKKFKCKNTKLIILINK